MRAPPKIAVIAVLAVLIAVGWLFSADYSGSFASNSDAPESAEDAEGSGSLDGMHFVGMIGPEGRPKDVEDQYVFENGTFVSKECELRCDYPARPYFERAVGDRTQFISETRCPYKDAKIVWKGFVDGDKVEGVATWTIRRWYWTIEKKFAFSGRIVNESVPVASTE